MKIANVNKDEQHRDIATMLFLFVITFAVAGYFSTLGIDPHHDGMTLKPASDYVLSAKTSWTVCVPGDRGHSRLINAVYTDIPRPGFYPGRALIFAL
jgi:hypothetical protein